MINKMKVYQLGPNTSSELINLKCLRIKGGAVRDGGSDRSGSGSEYQNRTGRVWIDQLSQLMIAAAVGVEAVAPALSSAHFKSLSPLCSPA